MQITYKTEHQKPHHSFHIHLTLEELGAIRYTLAAGTEKLTSTTLYHKSMTKALKRSANQAKDAIRFNTMAYKSAKDASDDAKKVCDDIELAVKQINWNTNDQKTLRTPRKCVLKTTRRPINKNGPQPRYSRQPQLDTIPSANRNRKSTRTKNVSKSPNK